MYSKERGNTFEPRPIPLRHQPMYHQPNRPRMQVPPNYNGHAIVDGEERPLGQTEEERVAESEPSPLDGPTPRFDGLPRVSDLSRGSDHPPWDSTHRGDISREPNRTEEQTDATRDRPVLTPAEAHVPGNLIPCYEAVAVPPAEESAPAMGTEKRKGLFDPSRFPFGRGLGMEELLILGLILFLLRESGDSEDRGDLDETVILLGLLLILG